MIPILSRGIAVSSLFHRAEREAADDVALKREAGNDRRYNRDEGDNGDVGPGRYARHVLSLNLDKERDRNRLGKGEHESQEIVIPGANEDQNEGGNKSRGAQRKRDVPEHL